MKDQKIENVEQDTIGHTASELSSSQLSFDHRVIPTCVERVNENVAVNSHTSPNNITDGRTTTVTTNTNSSTAGIDLFLPIIGQQQQDEEQSQISGQSQAVEVKEHEGQEDFPLDTF